MPVTMTEILVAVSEHIQRVTGSKFHPQRHRPLGGGCINRSILLEGGDARFFVKLNQRSMLEMFEAEAEGLRDLGAAGALRVPEPVCWGTCREDAYLVLEYVELNATGAASVHAALGRGLAAQHRATSTRFGWRRDNTIGSTPQPNSWRDDWAGFFGNLRLGHQLRLAGDNGIGQHTLSAGAELIKDLERFFADYTPVPSLLHGDLWAGNFAADPDGRPVIFDPATYYGDREADIAMTELFGGFGRSFYEAYNAAWPLDTGYRVRKKLYNLYHVLNHFNLFGGGYAAQAGIMIDELLASRPA